MTTEAGVSSVHCSAVQGGVRIFHVLKTADLGLVQEQVHLKITFLF